MSKILFTPGPTNVPEEIRQVLGQDLIHHRMADYHQLLKEINEDFKAVYKDLGAEMANIAKNISTYIVIHFALYYNIHMVIY